MKLKLVDKMRLKLAQVDTVTKMAIVKQYATGQFSLATLAVKFNLANSTVSDIVNLFMHENKETQNQSIRNMMDKIAFKKSNKTVKPEYSIATEDSVIADYNANIPISVIVLKNRLKNSSCLYVILEKRGVSKKIMALAPNKDPQVLINGLNITFDNEILFAGNEFTVINNKTGERADVTVEEIIGDVVVLSQLITHSLKIKDLITSDGRSGYKITNVVKRKKTA